MTTDAPVPRGADGTAEMSSSPLARLRSRPVNRNILWGLGPLIIGIVLFLLMVLLVPTVAPEQIVERPVETPASGPLSPGSPP